MNVLDRIDSLVLETAAAIFSTTLLQYNLAAEAELWSEALCWIAIPAALATIRLVRKTPAATEAPDNEQRPWLPWLIAGGLVVASLCRTITDIRWALPILTPTFVIYRHYTEPGELPQNRSPDSSLLSFLGNTIQGTLLVAFVAVASFIWIVQIRSAAFAVIAAIALFASIFGFSLLFVRDETAATSKSLEKSVQDVAWRTVVFLSAAAIGQTLYFGTPYDYIGRILAVATLKSIHWLLILRITQRAPWDIATTIETFTFASVGGQSAWSSLPPALAHITTSALSLAQTITILPKSARSRWVLWIFQITPFLVLFVTQDVALQSAQHIAGLLRPGEPPPSSSLHPLQDIIKNAEVDFETMMGRQSQTFKEAKVEYTRRYGRDPPPGFEDWFNFAKSHNSVVIDEFDIINERLAPFYKMTGEQYKKQLDDTGSAPGNRLTRCSWKDGGYSGGCTHLGERVDKLLQVVKDKLPNVKILINPLDEPSLILRPGAPLPNQLNGEDPVRFVDKAHSPVFEQLTEHCPKKAKRSYVPRVETYGLPFVQDLQYAQDLCLHPEYADMHGFFTSPTSFKFTNQAAPFLSPATPSTMRDILFPAPAYSGDDFKYDPDKDPDWSEKKKVLYWAGSSTGSHGRVDSWRKGHRQRFVQYVNNVNGNNHYSYLERQGQTWKLTKTTKIDSSQYDVFFSKIIQCDGRACDEQNEFFKPQERAGQAEPANNQLDFDIDGNGMSGRFYRFLESKSAPVKMTVFREWHDERVMPWIHYIPVSLSMEELPELVLWLTSTSEGQASAKRIADQGRDYAPRSIRDIDQTIYLYRLFLELARLQDPARQAGT